jgi:hypothetical protein
MIYFHYLTNENLIQEQNLSRDHINEGFTFKLVSAKSSIISTFFFFFFFFLLLFGYDLRFLAHWSLSISFTFMCINM